MQRLPLHKFPNIRPTRKRFHERSKTKGLKSEKRNAVTVIKENENLRVLKTLKVCTAVKTFMIHNSMKLSGWLLL